RNQNIDFTPMTAYEVKMQDWEFSVAHSTMTEKEFKTIEPEARFKNLRQHFINLNNGAIPNDLPRPAIAGADARSWDFWIWQANQNQNRRCLVWAVFVPQRQTVHQYVLVANGPGGADFSRFFNSFRFIESSGGIIFEEIDTPING